ncbi:hypothetical protein OF83DRAFT_1062983 [Amylostereum chailletii]|nr:hypothetical protein OF83DRAFT_1062983 [Amylostereum chailletii]
MLAAAVPAPREDADPCAAIAGKTLVAPADAIACQKAFPFNETLRQNVLAVVDGAFNFFTFEDYYLDSSAPFQEGTIDIRAELARINATSYTTDYEFNLALWNFTMLLNDGHTRWLPDCYDNFQNVLPTPVVILNENGEEGVYVIPDSVDLFTNGFGEDFLTYYSNLNFDWKRLAGAKITQIAGQDPFAYIDKIASTFSGNYLDHNIRINSVVSSYRVSNSVFSQRLGDLAGPSILTQTHLPIKFIPANSTTEEDIDVPFIASFSGKNFTDKASYWANNCVATKDTNGKDYSANIDNQRRAPKRPMAVLADAPKNAIDLPGPFLPTAPPVSGSGGVIKSFILPGNETAVMYVGSFGGDYSGFQTDLQAAFADFKAAGVTNLLIDLTNNGGGYVCLGFLLHQYLSGSKIGYPGFQSTARAAPLAIKIVESNIALGNGASVSYYGSNNWAFLNDTAYPVDYNYFDPPDPLTVNGRSDPTSQRFEDICTPFNIDVPEEPYFDLSKVAVVGNGNCASTCALFSSLMYERHGTQFALFGGKASNPIEIKGMAGNQVLEWSDLNSEVKSAHLQNDPLAMPDLLVSGNMRINWRTAWSYSDESKPIAYVSEPAQHRFAYTKDTYNNPQNIWTFACVIYIVHGFSRNARPDLFAQSLGRGSSSVRSD